jgi:hypothetical protein
MQVAGKQGVMCRLVAATLILCVAIPGSATAEEPAAKPKRVLLVGQGPDGHAWGSHEYHDGIRIVAEILQQVPGVQAIVVNADEPWSEGPELLDGADGAFLYLAEGAKWLSRSPARLAAFEKFAERKGRPRRPALGNWNEAGRAD